MPSITQKQKPLELYVAPDGNDAWSGACPAANRTRTDGPLATPAEALRRAAARPAETDARIRLRGGRYELARPPVITPAMAGGQEWLRECGSYKMPIREWSLRIEAFEDERPVLSGGRRVTGWTTTVREGQRVWSAPAPRFGRRGAVCRQLFVNGERRPRARWPKKGLLRVADVPGWRAKEGDPDLPAWRQGQHFFRPEPGDWPRLRHAPGLEIVFLQRWTESRCGVVSWDAERRRVSLDRPARFSLIHDGEDPNHPQGARYFMENVLDVPMEPGEWAWDAEAARIYYRPLPGETPEGIEAVVPVLPEILRLRGGVRCVRFAGVTFAHNEWRNPPDVAGANQAANHVPGAVILTGARDVEFARCDFTHLGAYGLELLDGTKNVAVINCRFADLGAGGVKIWHGCAHNTVSDSEVCAGGRVFPSAVGLLIGDSGGNRILRNRVHDLHYTGISAGWTWGYAESGAFGNIIENNHVYDIGGDLLSDMGGIYLLGPQPGSRVRFNIVRNVRSAIYGGNGLYADEGCADLLFEGNLVFACRSSLFAQHYGRRNSVRGNLLVGGDDKRIVLHRVEPGRLGLIFEDNAVRYARGEAFSGGYANKEFDPAQVAFRGNVYWCEHGEPRFMGLHPAAWRRAGMDTPVGPAAAMRAAWRRMKDRVFEGLRDTPGAAEARALLARFEASPRTRPVRRLSRR